MKKIKVISFSVAEPGVQNNVHISLYATIGDMNTTLTTQIEGHEESTVYNLDTIMDLTKIGLREAGIKDYNIYPYTNFPHRERNLNNNRVTTSASTIIVYDFEEIAFRQESFVKSYIENLRKISQKSRLHGRSERWGGPNA